MKLQPLVTERNRQSQETQTSSNDYEQLQNVSKRLAEMEDIFARQVSSL